jgi:predicted TIM-barrel fold metal-dependent hydrolase
VRLITLSAMLMLITVAAAVIAVTQAPESRLAIFDAHIHYSEPSWKTYPPIKIRRLLRDAGIAGAAIPSSPDDGTRRFVSLNRARFVAVLRPYRKGVTSANWAIDPNGERYLDERLASGRYQGIGEVHFQSAAETTKQVARRAAELAIAHDIPLLVYSGKVVIQSLRWQFPELKLLWAHGGMIGPLLGEDNKLWVELSFRAADIAGESWVRPAWRSLFVNYPDRFVIGSDTYVTGRWDSYGDLIGEHRRWLDQLPPAVAKAIAFDNAARLFLGRE